MNAQQLHHQSVPHGILCQIDPEDFTELHMSGEAAHDDFDWEEYESEYAEESLPNHVFSFIKEAAWE